MTSATVIIAAIILALAILASGYLIARGQNEGCLPWETPQTVVTSRPYETNRTTAVVCR